MATRSSPLLATALARSNLYPILLTVGTIWTISKFYQLTSWLHLNFLRSTSISKYQHSSYSSSATAWALITGASDGIGRGFAEELSIHGFNLILHGRNEAKLEAVRTALQDKHPERSFKLLIFDAGAVTTADLSAAVQPLTNLNITILINNLGGAPPPNIQPLASFSARHVRDWIDINANFTTEITRLLLPTLYRNGPSLILTMGSLASSITPPYASIYAGVKAYGEALSRSLRLEVRAEGHAEVEVMHLVAGEVQSGREPGKETSFARPSSRAFAKAAVRMVGCGRAQVTPWWPHALQAGVMGVMPGWVVERLVVKMGREEREKEEQMLKAKER